MRGRRKKQDPMLIPMIADGMCGRCRNWRRIEDEEGGDCAVLAISHMRGGRVRLKFPVLTHRSVGPLVAAVYDRTMAADEGFYWDEEGGGEIVPAEDFSGVPRTYYDDHGEKKKVWSPLWSYAWFSCSRHRAKALPNRPENITEMITEPVG